MELDLTNFITSQIFIVAMVFCRIGTALLFIPGLGETYIPSRVKLLIALALSIALTPFIGMDPFLPSTLSGFVRIIVIETLIGLWIGVVARTLLISLQYAGVIGGQVSALANAFAPSVGAFQGATILSTFLMLGGIMIVFAADIHHVMIKSFVYSYDIFPIGQYIAGDFSEQSIIALSVSSFLAFIIATPFLVMGITVNVGLGLANRMMPTLPVFFVAVSILIALGIFILSKITTHALQLFADTLVDWLKTFEFDR